MKSFAKRLIVSVTLVLLGLALLFAETSAFAWLSTAVNLGTATLTTSDLNAPDYELWTSYKDKESQEYLWKKTYVDGETVEEKKYLPSIGEFTTTTFTPTDSTSLYFGAIQNLAQEKDNLPVYMKYTITLLPHTSNTVTISEEFEDDYLKFYLVDLTDDDRKANLLDASKNAWVSTLNNSDEYPFLNLRTFWSQESADNYSLTGDALPKGLDDEDAEVDNFEKIETTKVYTNDTDDPMVVYLYLRYTVSPDTLQKALLTDLRINMPCYLIFDVKLTVDIQTVAN